MDLKAQLWNKLFYFHVGGILVFFDMLNWYALFSNGNTACFRSHSHALENISNILLVILHSFYLSLLMDHFHKTWNLCWFALIIILERDLQCVENSRLTVMFKEITWSKYDHTFMWLLYCNCDIYSHPWKVIRFCLCTC